MDYKALVASLKAKDYAPVYLLQGGDEYYIDKLVTIFENDILNETEKAFNYAVLYGKDVDHKTVIEYARQFPVMAEKKLIILKEAKTMRSLSNMSNYFKAVSPSTILLIVHKHGKIDGRSSLLKEIKKVGVVFTSDQLREYQVAPWVKDYVREQGYKIDNVAAEMLVEFTGTNLSSLSNEISKILINLKKGETITKDWILDQVGINKDYNEFELQNAIGERNITKAHKIILYFAVNTKSHPLVRLLSTLYNYYSKLYIAKSLKSNISDRDYAAALGMGTTWFVKDYRKAAANYTLTEIEKCIETLHIYDLKSKGMFNNNFSEGDLMKELIERLLFVKHAA